MRREFTNNWFDITARQLWEHFFPRMSPTKILEIGSYEGASACYIIDKCAAERDIELHCVDTWLGGAEHAGRDMPAVKQRFQSNVDEACKNAKCNVDLHVHEMTSRDALASYITSGHLEHFDFIYIDGSHSAVDVLTDAVMAFPLLKVGGFMCFDDYLWQNGGSILDRPKVAIDAFCNIFSGRVEVSFVGPQVFLTKMGP